MVNMLEDIIKLIQLLESPHIERRHETFREEDLMRLFRTASKNGISHLFLTQTVQRTQISNKLRKIWERHKMREQCFLMALKRIVESLSASGVNYALYKTLRPYPFEGAVYDIDVLVFERSEIKELLKLLKKKGYDIESLGLSHIALRDVKVGFPVDIYLDISYADIAYIDKHKLGRPVLKDIHGLEVSVFPVEADLLATIGHSVYGDRHYTLKDFYTTLFDLKHFTQEQKESFVRLVKEQKLEFATRLILSLTQHLHAISLGEEPKGITEIYKDISQGIDPLIALEIKRLTSYGTPLRYSILTYVKSNIVSHGFTKEFTSLVRSSFIKAFLYELKIRTKDKIR